MWGHYFDNLLASFPFFIKGLGMTMLVSLFGLIGGTVLGFVAGIARSTGGRWLRRLIGLYVDLMRGTPFLVQVFIVFFIMPEWGIHLDAFAAAVLSLIIYGAAYICEIVAGGIQAIPPGQIEAAMASGFGWMQRLRLIVLPQAMRPILPPLVGQYVLMIKDSSVVSVIGITDVTRVGWLTVQRIPEGLMVFGLVGLLYFSICYPLIRLSNWCEARLAVQQTRL